MAAATNQASHYDVVIVGGGMVGASLALALRATPLRVLLIEAVAADSAGQPSFDERTTAIGNGSRQIFTSLELWEPMAREAGLIRSIHVSDAGRFGMARLLASEQGVEALGYVIPNRTIGRVLWEALRVAPNITLRVPARPLAVRALAEQVEIDLECEGRSETVRAALAVAADGAQSILRANAGIEATVEDYDQLSIVVNAASERPNDGSAFERFTAQGPMAVLPLADGSYTIVWAAKPDRARELLALTDSEFMAELMRVFGWRAGRWLRVGKRASYPLKLSRATATVAQRTVLIGNAAQALHPVAGQGFNLGLRDAATLAEMLAEAPGDPGAAALLARFTDAIVLV
jgi:2-octaprenyl-6-methoxyphenol hydroxylase